MGETSVVAGVQGGVGVDGRIAQRERDTARKRLIRPCTLVPVELSTGTNGAILYRSKNQSLLVPARGSSRY